MFTKDEIKATHANVKSGADFPKYVADLKRLGVIKYDYRVEDGSIVFSNAEGEELILELMPGNARKVTAISSAEKIKYAVKVTQQGKSDFPTFCLNAADAGVSHWLTDLQNMTCSYFDLNEFMLYSESIPEML